uniref:Uncharacterized protein n=1 Tax=Avena sativa TaxID=4498 RepID=A0ACD5US25_AVESA
MAGCSVRLLLLLCLLGSCSAATQQKSDSCAGNLAVARLVPFDTSAFHCITLWKQEDFILRYKNTATNQWSFVLSAPDKKSWVAVGFSGKGGMVGSSAMVGWSSSSGGKAVAKQYYLQGRSPESVAPDDGKLTLVRNRTATVSSSGRLYLAFQLSTDHPQPYLIYAVGYEGNLPNSPDFMLQQHRDMGARGFNYASATLSEGGGGSSDAGFPTKRWHGLLSMMGWGVLLPMGMMVARYFRRQDPYWFYGHMAVQGVGFLLGIAAVILGFRLNSDGLNNIFVHKAIGITILSTASLQVTAVLARPDKMSKVRRFWNWYHHNIGRAAILLAIANVFLGLTIAKEVSAYIVSYGVFVAVWVMAVAAFEFKRYYEDDDD